MLFYDFEVFHKDWLVVIADTYTRQEHIIVNDKNTLQSFFDNHKKDIWCGFNNVHYDQYIMKAVLLEFDPKEVSDYIIKKGFPGWKYTSLFRKINFCNYDVMQRGDRGLKVFEGYFGDNIKESSVPFDIMRKLNQTEINETIKYCKHDVRETMKLFIARKSDFNAHMGLVKLACKGKDLDLSLLSKTKAQLSAIILGAEKQNHNDEFDIDIPRCLQIKKYKYIVDWYMNESNHCYTRFGNRKTPEKIQLKTNVAGVPHVFGWGGVHGAREKYHGVGYFINMDVASLYPSLMILYDLGSRNVKNPKKYEEIYHQRLKYKKEKNPLQAPLKIVLNSTYGVMKDKNNPLYDPRQANRVCVYGQLLLLDLIEHLEPFCDIIQSNTDGILVKMPQGEDEYKFYYKIDDIAAEWEERTGLILEFDEYKEVYQKDVNNYIVIAKDGSYKSKGAYLKKLTDTDRDLYIVNRAVVNYFTHSVSPRDTILESNDLSDFQMICKISDKYKGLLYGSKLLPEKCVRVFASKKYSDPGIRRISKATGRHEKMSGTPERCFVVNENVSGEGLPQELDTDWYIKTAEKRISEFTGEKDEKLEWKQYGF